MKEKLIISAFTLAGSLGAYFYARHIDKDEVPYVLIGGFIGDYIGGMIVNYISRDKDNSPNT